MELTDKEKGLIKECLILIAKSSQVGIEQMKELILLAEKFIVENKEKKN